MKLTYGRNASLYMASHGSLYFRIAAATGTLFGSSWLIVLAFDRYLTPLLVETAVRTLNDPEVEEEVYQLFKTLLDALLSDPTIRAKAPHFLKQVMSQDTFEDASKVLIASALDSDIYHGQAMALLRLISSNVFTDLDLDEKVTKASYDVVGAVKRARTMPEALHVKQFQLPQYDHVPIQIQAPEVDFAQSVSSFQRTLTQFELQHYTVRIREEAHRNISSPYFPQPETSFPALRMDVGAEMASICLSTIPSQEKIEQLQVEHLLDQIGAVEYQLPQLLPAPVVDLADKAALEHVEANYLTY